MVVIRRQQIEVFGAGALAAFEREMIDHSKQFSPRLCQVLGDDQLRVALRTAITRADGYGFSNRGSLRLFIELMFLFGSAFDTDPQYAWAGRILGGRYDQMKRAEELYDETIRYQQHVAGPDGVNTRKALNELQQLALRPLPFESAGFVDGMLAAMSRVFPEKAAYVGPRALRAIVDEGLVDAERYRFENVRGATLLVALRFAFGHGCGEDPLYPWIGATLNDQRIVTSAARADRLERKTLTWLSHVLAEAMPS